MLSYLPASFGSFEGTAELWEAAIPRAFLGCEGCGCSGGTRLLPGNHWREWFREEHAASNDCGCFASDGGKYHCGRAGFSSSRAWRRVQSALYGTREHFLERINSRILGCADAPADSVHREVCG